MGLAAACTDEPERDARAIWVPAPDVVLKWEIADSLKHCELTPPPIMGVVRAHQDEELASLIPK